MIASKVDTAILDELFLTEDRRKETSLFRLARAEKSVNVLMKGDFQAGIYCRAYLMHYRGDTKGALTYLEKNISKYGALERFCDGYIGISLDYGDYEQTLKAIKLYLENVKAPEDNITIIKNWLLIYQATENIYPLDNINEIIALNQKQQNELQKLGVSLDTYRRVLFLMRQVYNEFWYGSIITSNEYTDTDVVLRFEIENATPTDTRQMTNKLNDLIFAYDDEVFQSEVQKIVAYFSVARDSSKVA